MRLHRLKLSNYGIFKNRTFDFDDAGVVLVYGPNEAGKSTLLQALRESFFGMSTRNEITSARTVAEVHASLANGDRFHYERRRGRQNLVKGEFDSSGRSIDENKLSQMLGALDMNAYCSLFGFSLEELARGQQALSGLSLTEAMLGAKGGASLDWKSTKESLVERRDKLLTKQGRTQEIVKLVQQIRDYQKKIEEASTLPQDYELVSQKLDAIDAKHQLCSGELEKLVAAMEDGKRREKAIPIAKQLLDDRLKLQKYDLPAQLSRQWNESWRTCQKSLERVSNEVKRRNEEIATIEAEIGAIKLVDEPKVDGDAIQRLAFQVQAIRETQSKLDAGQQELVACREREIDLARIVGESIVNALPSDFAVTRPMKEELRHIADQIQIASRDRLGFEQRIQETTAKLGQLEAAQSAAKGSDQGDNDRLKELSNAVRSFHNEMLKYREACRQAERDRREVERVNATLTELVGDAIPHVEIAKLPSDEVIADYASRIGQLRKRWDDLDRRLREATQRLESILGSKRETSVSSSQGGRDEIEAMRTKRNQLWEQWQLLESQSDKERLPLFDVERREARERFVDHLKQEDQLIDSILDNVQSFIAVEQEQVARRTAEEEVRRLGVEFSVSENALNLLHDEWLVVWNSSGISPGEVDKMHILPSFVRSRHELVASLDQHRQVGGHLADRWRALLVEVEQVRSQFAEWQSEEVVRTEPLGGDAKEVESQRVEEWIEAIEQVEQRLSEIWNRAMKLASSREAERKQREECVLLQAQLESSLAQATSQRDTQQARYRTFLQGLQLDWTLPCDVAIAKFEQVEDLLNCRRELSRSADEIKSLQNTLNAFHHELKQTLAADPTIAVADDIEAKMERLLVVQALLEQARKQRETLQQCKTRLEENRKQLVDCSREQAEAMANQKALVAVLGLDSIEQANKYTSIADDAWKLQSEIQTCTKQLEVLANGKSMESFLDELVKLDDDAVRSDAKRLEKLHAEKKEECNKLLIEKGDFQNQLRQMFDDGQVTRLTLELESLKAKLDDKSREWMVLSTSVLLLDRSLEEFRRGQQGAILELVRRNFSRLTMGRYVDVQPDRQVEHSFHVVDHDGESKTPTQLSQGTREQLYLALRFAFVQQYCQQNEPLPIVMDDCFVNFDDDRLLQTLEAVSEICESSQCIVLSCHRRTVDAIRRVSPTARVIELQDVYTSSRT